MVEELQKLLEHYYGRSGTIRSMQYHEALDLAKKAYELGKSSEKSKKEDDNPYHIDHQRQTKLQF